MPGRSYNSAEYRYGFNGQEKDDEVYGGGNSTTAEFWQYDTRLGRRWNVDPILKDSESPYFCFNGNPISRIDPDGKDGTAVITNAIDKKNDKGKVTDRAGSKTNPHSMEVSATYYYNKSNLNSKYSEAETQFQNAVKSYNSSNETVKGEDGQFYKVTFKISLMPVDEGADANIAASNDYVGEDYHNRKGNIAGTDILTPTSEQKKRDPLGLGGAKAISLLTEGIDKLVGNGYEQSTVLYNVFLHEIGHNLGSSHDDGGAMVDQNLSSFNNTQVQNGSSPDFRNNTITYTSKLSPQNVKGIISTIWNTTDPNRSGKIHLIKK